MSSNAHSVRICASSNTSMSTLSKPRPKPFSLAPNMTRDPLANTISCWPFALLGSPSTNRLIALRRTRAHMNLNVSSLVRVLCAVHSTFSGSSEVLPRMQRPNWRCQPSYSMPHSRAWASTLGHPVVSIFLGSTTCRATSDSLRRSGLTLDLARIERFILYLRRGRRIGPAVLGFKTLNLTTHLKQPPSQRRQITRRRPLVKHRNLKAMRDSLQ